MLSSRADWTAGGQVASLVPGRSIFWRRDGDPDGDPVTLLHGFPTSSHDWEPMIPALTAAGFAVTTVDLLGFGASDKPTDHRFSIMEQASIVEALWEHCGVDGTAVMAHDYSVTVAQELLARDPARITSMTFLNGGVYPDLHRPILVQRLLRSPLGRILGRFSSERMFRAAMDAITAEPLAREDLHELWLDISTAGGQRIQHDLLRYIDDRRQHAARWTAAMESYSGPVHCIWGPEDPISGAQVLERLRTRMPRAEFTALSGVGHYPHLEDSPAVAEAMVAFLAAHRPQSRP
ncbi:alpha/beta hydrolase [uncultured Williamsia sp.]|uniref:alpha/beta fold hydrolase n=1 Tax=uncultured Williamsia sp. TaxID=259311 RepID=UPI0026351775|nr:alpha/beta hydrolase [uncultured Williamsia sp.]